MTLYMYTAIKFIYFFEFQNAEMFDKQKIHFAKAIEDVEKKFM